MKKAFSSVFAGSLVLVFALGTANAQATPSPKAVTITGSVESIDEDEQGNPIAVAIEVQVEDEEYGSYPEYYYVAKTPKGKELLKLVGKGVTATGTIDEDEDGVKTITVKSYTVLKAPPKPKAPAGEGQT